MAPAKPVASVARHAHQDDQGSQNAPSLPPNDPIAVGWRAPPSRRCPLQYGVANAPQDVVSNEPPLLQQVTRERSNSLGDTTEPTNQIKLHEPRPSEQVAHACEYLYDANRRDSTIVSPATRGFQITALATTAALVNPVLKSNKKKPHSGHLPLVKLLVCGYHGDCYSAADIKDFTAVCLKCVNGLCAGNIRIYSGRGPKGEEFDWFFDPDGITPGGLLILCITGHGKPTEEGVELRTDRAGPMLMDTFDLHTAINGLKIPCTLEIVLATCYSEAVISGLDRLLAMKSPEAPEVLPPPNTFLFKSLHPGNLIPRLDTQATIIVWAAADGGPAYSEADLPSREGKNDIVIGAMCRALESAAGGVSRRVLFGKVQEAVTEYNTARDAKYHSKSKEDQEEAYKSRTYRGPQLACLLSSAENKELILNSPAFQAL